MLASAVVRETAFAVSTFSVPSASLLPPTLSTIKGRVT